MFTKQSLRFKFISLVIVMIVVFVSVGAVFVIMDKRQYLYDSLLRKAELFGRYTAGSIYDHYGAYYVYKTDKDFQKFKQLIGEILAKNKDIVHTFLLDRRGDVYFDSLEFKQGLYTGAEKRTPADKKLIEEVRELENRVSKETVEASFGRKVVFEGEKVIELFCPIVFEKVLTAVVVHHISERSIAKEIIKTTWGILTIAIGFIILGIISVIFLANGITSALVRVIVGLADGSEQTAGMASEVANASDRVSQGATEQAASIQETSSLLTDIKTTIKKNADNTGQADKLAKEARSSAEQGDLAMADMKKAMVDINQASEKISKIIKAIEDIAFQTNILALNAAVEAARAGEYGKGFAVVAEEVRNLAKRSAAAAKDTAELIEDSVSKIDRGSEIVDKVGNTLKAIVENSNKVAGIVSEITQASLEQSEGVNQVTSAITQMDQVTQQNATSAEQAASAAQGLSSQASVLKSMIDELEKIVKGSQGSMTLAQSKIPGLERRGKSKNQASPRIISPEEAMPF